MASIDRRGDRWRARWREHPGANPRSRTFDRKVDAQRFLAEVSADLLRGTYVDPSAGRITLADYASQWVASQPWRPSTRERTEAGLRRILPVLGHRPLRTIRPSDVQAFVGGLSADGLAPSYVESLYRLLVSILKAAVADRLLAETPCRGIRLPTRERSKEVQDILSVGQVNQLAAAIGPRWRALVLTAAGLGLRQGEACGLTVDRVDFLRRTVRIDRQLVTGRDGVRFGPPKTPASDRTLPLPATVAEVLAEHLRIVGPGDDDLMFTLEGGRAIPRNRLGDRFRAAAHHCRLEGVTFHDLRHFTASALIASGCTVKAIQAFLGHATAAETLDTYGHLWPDDDERLRAGIDRVFAEGMAQRRAQQ
jgi:integrase